MSAPQIEQEARHAAAEGKASLDPVAPRELPWRPALVVAAAAAVAAVLFAGFQAYQAQPSVSAIADQGERLSSADMAQLEENRGALESAGLASGTIYVRDYAAEDGDGVVLNGTRITIFNQPTPLSVTSGPLMLTAAAGSTGCVTVEIGDSAGGYQLCLRDGDPIRTRAR